MYITMSQQQHTTHRYTGQAHMMRAHMIVISCAFE
jgi:hypothetical protein